MNFEFRTYSLHSRLAERPSDLSLLDRDWPEEFRNPETSRLPRSASSRPRAICFRDPSGALSTAMPITYSERVDGRNSKFRNCDGFLGFLMRFLITTALSPFW